MTAQERYQLWCQHQDLLPEYRQQLEDMSNDLTAIEDSFYQELQFGTAGLRGILGAGSNRMNYYTVTRAAEGFARFFLSQGEEYCKRGLAISYDSRNMSAEFAHLTARIFVGHGINVFLADELRPVPMLSYAVRSKNCAGGVMITASHNPKEYNGFKAYGEDGGQLPPEAAKAVATEMDKLADYLSLYQQVMPEAEAKKRPQWHELGEEFDQEFNAMLQELVIDHAAIQEQHDLKIIYTPLHGSGNKPVRRILAAVGFTNVEVVPEQEKPDGNFPTAPYPNPEERAALNMAIELAEKRGADLVIATDPDADRTGVAVRNKRGEMVVLTGNQIGLLLMDYILSAKRQTGKLPAKSFCVTTIVSSKLTQVIAEHFGCDLTQTLTGFKYIGEQIKLRDEEGDEHFQFGFEESFGYLAGTKVRDKDAVVATMLIAEMAASAARKGETLYDRLEQLFAKYGYAAEKTISVVLEGKAGQEKIAEALAYLRQHKQDAIGDLPITKIADYQERLELDLATGATKELTLPESNVLLYYLEGLDWFCVRPSGTEPKLKIYMGFYARSKAEAEAKLAHAENMVSQAIQAQLN